jgi:hypothetical protein
LSNSCLILLNEIDGPYFYGMIGCASIIPGSLSYLLCITVDHLMTAIPFSRWFQYFDLHYKIQEPKNEDTGIK